MCDGLVDYHVRRLLPIALAVIALTISHEAYGVPVNPAPAASATFDGAVHAIAYWGNVIYVGGEFTHATAADGVRVRRARLAAVDAGSGALLDWAPAADGTVVDLAVDGTGVYVTGDFKSVNLESRDSLAKLDLWTGAPLPAFNHRIYGHPNALVLGHGRVYLGGTITSVNDIPRGTVAAFDAMTGALDLAWTPALSGPVYSLYAAPDRIYLGGMFDSVNGALKTQKLAAVRPDTAQVDTTFVSYVHARVTTLYLHGDTLYAGVDGDGGRAVAMDLAGTPKWTVTVDGDVQGIATLDGLIYLGGHFDNVCKTGLVGTIKGKEGSHCVEGADPRIKLAAVDMNGVLQPWTANASGTIGVRALAANPGLGQLAAGGYFRNVSGQDRPRFAVFRI